jgi:hypothetical protein
MHMLEGLRQRTQLGGSSAGQQSLGGGVLVIAQRCPPLLPQLAANKAPVNGDRRGAE